MSQIDVLINKFCLNGAVYKSISEIANISRGQVMSKDFLRDNAGEYPVYSSQTENNGMLGRITTYMFDGEYLTWTTDGANAGTVFYRNEKFSVTNVCGVVDVTDDAVSTKYLFYALNREAPQYVNKGMGNPKLMSNVMARIRIPLPPLAVQQEIVRILDSFTELTTELNKKLTAELTARRKQYEHYRDELLTFGDDVPITALGNIAQVNVGSKPAQICNNTTLFEYINAGTGNSGYTSEANCDGDTVTTPSRGQGGIGYIGYQANPFWLGPLCYKIRVKSNEKHLNKFLFYYLQSKNSEILKMKKEGGVPAINQSDLIQMQIPLLPIERQQSIVKILDRFDTLCNDLTSGLPAEIAARQKQYEYYRDKLLAFKELEV